MGRISTVLLIAGWPVSLWAQTAADAGAVRGTVRDESGAMVSGAKVCLLEESKGLARESESDARGSFLFTSVIGGLYSLRVEKEGFNTERVERLRIEVGGQVSLGVVLHVGSSRTVISVVPPRATELQAESNTLGSVVDSARVSDLPLSGRQFLKLAELSAGSVEVSSASNLFNTNVGPSNRTVVLPGTLPSSVSFYLNGINITGSRDGELALSPSIVAIDEFKLQESFLMPDEGIHPALVNIVTKSGSNRFGGEIFEFFRNARLDARSFFAASRDDVKLNQFGGAAGGPLAKNRVWFYGFYEGLRELTAFPAAAYTPTAAMFQGDFGGTGRVLYDPASYNSSTNTREPFPDGSRIPTTRINSVSRNLLGYYQAGSSLASSPANLFATPRMKERDDQGGIRLDAGMGPRAQLFGQFFRQRAPEDDPGTFPFSGLLYLNWSDLAMLQETYSLSPRTVNVLRLGFLRNGAIGGNEAGNSGPNAASIGVANTFATAGVPAINLQGYSSFGKSNGEIGNRDDTWQLDEELTYTRGAHTFAAGAGLVYRRGWHSNGNGSALGSLSFQPVFTAQTGVDSQGRLTPTANSGDAFADFLLGLPVTGIVNGLPTVPFRSMQLTAYMQDSWRLTRTLTVNWGMAWFAEDPPDPEGWSERYIHTFDFATGLPLFAALGQTSGDPVKTRNNNISPRLGLAWRPDFLKGIVVRAAAGIYYSSFPWVIASDSVQGPPAGFGQSFSNPLSTAMPAYALGLSVFSPPVNSPLTAGFAASLPPGTTLQAIDPNFHTASLTQWNFSLQRSFGEADSVELDYQGSSAHHLPNLSDPAQCRPGPNLLCDSATRPYPRYGLILYADSSGNSSYQALIGKYERRVNSGLNLRVEYGLAKALTDSWQSSLSVNQITDCRRCSKGPATFDVRQRAVASLLWKIPFGRGHHAGATLPRWVNGAAGGWSVSAITTFAAGQPVPLTAPNQTGSPFIQPLPNRVCDGRSSRLSNDIRGNGMLWFDGSCFAVPPAGYFGNSGATVVTGPGINNWDIGMQKTIGIARERVKLHLRAEMFNAWNHAQFAQPNGNAGAGVNFGRISAAMPPRLVQLAAKLGW